MLETVGIDLAQERFRQLLHIYLYQICKKEKEYVKLNKYYDEADKDKKIIDLMLSTKASEFILDERDESYGNTPLHIACSLHSFVFTKYLLHAGADESIKNLQDKTPEEILKDEIKKFMGFTETKDRDITLERLKITQSLFLRM